MSAPGPQAARRVDGAEDRPRRLEQPFTRLPPLPRQGPRLLLRRVRPEPRGEEGRRPHSAQVRLPPPPPRVLRVEPGPLRPAVARGSPRAQRLPALPGALAVPGVRGTEAALLEAGDFAGEEVPEPGIPAGGGLEQHYSGVPLHLAAAAGRASESAMCGAAPALGRTEKRGGRTREGASVRATCVWGGHLSKV